MPSDSNHEEIMHAVKSGANLDQARLIFRIDSPVVNKESHPNHSAIELNFSLLRNRLNLIETPQGKILEFVIA